jgi:WhiB family transcriptional regulator, redox-sensing transcriptional regulator
MTHHATDWREAGACLSADPELFFPIGSSGPSAGQVSSALRVCATCGVRQQCLDFAMQMNEADGIWGGTTPEERIRARRRNLRRAPRRSRQEVPESRAC